MPKAIRNTKPAIDPIFAILDDHSRAFAVYEPFARKLNAAAAEGGCEEGDALHEEHEAAAEVMFPLYMALHDAQATTPAGRIALRAYMKVVDAKDILEKKWSLGRAATRRIRARLTLITNERPEILPEEINEAMTGDRKLDDFCRRHAIFMDWLLGYKSNVSLKMLLIMTQDYRRSRSFAAITGG